MLSIWGTHKISSYFAINANLANFRVFLESLGGFVALDKVDVIHKTSASPIAKESKQCVTIF